MKKPAAPIIDAHTIKRHGAEGTCLSWHGGGGLRVHYAACALYKSILGGIGAIAAPIILWRCLLSCTIKKPTACAAELRAWFE